MVTNRKLMEMYLKTYKTSYSRITIDVQHQSKFLLFSIGVTFPPSLMSGTTLSYVMLEAGPTLHLLCFYVN